MANIDTHAGVDIDVDADTSGDLDDLCWAPDVLLTPFPIPDAPPLFLDAVDDPLALLGAPTDVPDVDFERYLAPITAQVNNCPPPPVTTSTTPRRLSLTGKRAFADDVPQRPKRPKSCIVVRTPAKDALNMPLTPPPPPPPPNDMRDEQENNAPVPMLTVDGDEPMPLDDTAPAPVGLPNPITDELAARIGRICNPTSPSTPKAAPARRRRSSLRIKNTSTSLPDVGAALLAVRRAAQGYQTTLRAPHAPAQAHAHALPQVSAPQGALAKSVYRQTALVARMRKPGRKKKELTRFDTPIASPAPVKGAKRLAADATPTPTPLQCYMQSS